MPDIETMLEACETAAAVAPRNGGARFTQWEREFLESVREQFDERGALSEKQIRILRDMWDKT